MHQLLRGNLARSAGSLDAIASGQAPPPELDVVRTPRTGVPVTHRVALLLSAKPPASTGWATLAVSARAAAEPVLNAWAASLLGLATGVRCRVEELDVAGNAVRTHEVLLTELELSALDMVYAEGGRGAGDASEIELRVLEALRRKPAAPAAGASLRVVAARAAAAPPAERSLADVIELARRARAVLGGARALDGADLQTPHADPLRGLDLPQLAARADKAGKGLAAAHKAVVPLLAVPANLVTDAGRTALRRLAGFGIAAAVPVVPAGATADEARAALLVQAERRWRRPRGGWPSSPPCRCPRPPPPPKSSAMRSGSASPRSSAPISWFCRCSRWPSRLRWSSRWLIARPCTAAIRSPWTPGSRGWSASGSRSQSSALRCAPPRCSARANRCGRAWPSCRIAQASVGSRRAERRGAAARRSTALVLRMVDKLDLRPQPLAGLLIDEWVEIVPSAQETTAITFQYDAPDAFAPQAILLACAAGAWAAVDAGRPESRAARDAGARQAAGGGPGGAR